MQNSDAVEPRPPVRRFAQLPSAIYLMKSAESVIRSQTDALMSGELVTTMQYVALGVLQQHEHLSGAELARLSFVKPQSMQDIIRALEAKGLIERRRRAENRREMMISISPAGRDLMDALEPRMAALDDALVDGFSDAEVSALRGMLRRLKHNAAQFSPRDVRSQPR